MSKQDLDLTETKEITSSPSSYGLPLDRLVASQEITLLKPPLASGSYGVVYHALWQGQPVAVKQFTAFTAGENGQDFLREASLMLRLERLESPYLMPLKKICFEPPDHYWLVMELMPPPGSLHRLLVNNQDLPWSVRYQIGREISLGLSVLHTAGILHRDLKGLNILLTADHHVRVTDFGSAQCLTEEPRSSLDTWKSTPQWVASELFQSGAIWTEQAEIYSLGVVLWELAARRLPSIQRVLDLESASPPPAASCDPVIPDNCPPDLKSLIASCWQTPPSARPTAAAVAETLETLRLAAQVEEQKQTESSKQVESTVPPAEDKEKIETVSSPKSLLTLLPDYTPAIQIQTDIEQALREGLAFPNFRALLWGSPEKALVKKSQSTPVLEDWQLFWAVADACETALCFPHSTYDQQRQAMGEWEDTQQTERVTLASLVQYGLSLPRYQQSECVTALTQVFHRLLNPATVLSAWVRHSACHGWQILTQRLQTLGGEYILPLKKEIDRWQAKPEEIYRKDASAFTDYAQRFAFFQQAFEDWQRAHREKSDSAKKQETELTQALLTHLSQLSKSLSVTGSSLTPAKTEEKKSESLSLPEHAPWQEFAARFQGKERRGKDNHSQSSWFGQVVDWLNARLPASPCEFKPFVMVTAKRSYLLGIQLTDGFYRHHPFFSHWAECLRLCVGLFSEYRLELDVSGVSHFSHERFQVGGYLPDSIGASRELIKLPIRLSATHWRYQVTPMVRLDGDGKPLDLQGVLPVTDEKTYLRPHTVALNRQWQRHLSALTTDKPEEKIPVARLQWLAGGETCTRYFSAVVTKRLFQASGKEKGQLARHTRSATPGQSNMWRLTAADTVSPLPEYSDETILAYLKADPQHPWRQWQHLTLAQRLMDYGHTGMIATLAYGHVIKGQFQSHDQEAKPIPVWLSSPAGLTFCTTEEAKGSRSASDIQVLDTPGQERLTRYLAQLDPDYFTQAVFLTWLLVHEDDQLRNLGFESFINAQGEEKTRVIAFDTDTCLEAPWIRNNDGQIQIKLKSLVYCLDQMARPLSETACARFLALEPEAVLSAWLQQLMTAEKATENRLPPEGFEALYQRWLRLRQVLQLPIHSDDPMAPVLPRSHHELLRMLDPPLGEAYERAAQGQSQPLKRFDRVSQDYVVLSGMRISASSGLLRGASLAKPRSASVSQATESPDLTPRQALAQCESYRQQTQHLTRLVIYLTQQAKQIKGNPVFEKQMTKVVGDIQELNRQTQAELDQRKQQKSRFEHLSTRVSQWEPLIAPDLKVTIVLPETKESESMSAWQSACVRDAKPSIRFVKTSLEDTGLLSVHNGNYLIVNDQPLTASLDSKDAWDLTPFQKAVTLKPEAKTIRQACAQVYQQQLTDLDQVNRALLETEASLMRLTRQRQAQLLGQRKTRDKAAAWHELKETDTHFLTGLLDKTLRQAVMARLPWGQLPKGKGLAQLLRLLELGGLMELNLQDCQAVTETRMIAFLQNSPDLVSLNVSGCRQLTSTVIQQAALSALSLQRLSARQLSQLADLWRGALWLTGTALLFPHLTHADFRGCVNLMRIILQAPALRYLHLGGCATAVSRFSNAQDWTLTTPALKAMSLQDCTVLNQLKIDSDSLEILDARGAAIRLPLLKAMLTSKQWANVRRIELVGSQLPPEWKYLGDYPLVTPLAEREMADHWSLTALHTLFTRRQDMARLFVQLPALGRWRLQLGLVLFLWQQTQQLVTFLLSQLKSSDTAVRREAVSVLGDIDYASPTLAEQALTACLPLLKDYDEGIRHAAATAVGQIAAASPTLTQQALTACLLLLKDFDKDVRRFAATTVRQIAAAAPTEAGQALTACVPLLKDSDEHVRHCAVIAVSQIGAASPPLAEQALIACVPLLKDSDWDVRRTAATAVEQIAAASPTGAGQALPLCMPLLKDSDWRIRHAAATVVGQIGAASPTLAQQALIACVPLLKDSDWRIRRDVVTVVSQIAVASPTGAEQALTACVPLLKDSYWDGSVRSAAVSAMGQIAVASPPLAEQALIACLPLLKDSDWRIRREVVTAVIQITAASSGLAERSFTACLPLLKDSNEYVRPAAVTTIGRIAAISPGLAKRSFTACLPLLKDSGWDVRCATVAAVGQIGGASPRGAGQALPLCLPLLKDSDWSIRRAAATAVGQIVAALPTEAGQALTACVPLLKDSDQGIRRAAVDAVGQIAAALPPLAEQALPLCLPLLKDSDWSIRRAAAIAVRQSAAASPTLAQQALPACLPLLKDSDWRIRRDVVTVVSQIAVASPTGAEQALPAYLPLLKDSDRDVRHRAVTTVRQIAAAAPTEAGQALTACVPLLKDSDEHVRHCAVIAVSQIGAASPPLAEQALIACVPLLKDSDWRIRHAAVNCIGDMMSFHPILIYPFLEALPVLLKDQDERVPLSTITLFLRVSSKYQVRAGQTLGEYVGCFLQRWLIDHPIETQPLKPTAIPETCSQPSTSLPCITTWGDDRCLAKNGSERYYWYSLTDFSGLLTVLRAQHLNYRLPDDSKTEYPKPGGESASCYRENRDHIFIADPYLQVGDCQFGKFLVEDITVITQGTHIARSKRDPWRAMPQRLFFSLLYHAHWQLIALEIDYTQTQYHILWDNPFGQAGFSESFYQELLPSIHTAVSTLFQTHRKLTGGLSEESKLELKPIRLIKTLDQQGHGMNGYDCGPIAAQNLQDYVMHLTKNKPLIDFDEKHYTIPAAGVSGWESTLKSVREKHYQQARGITTTPSDIKRLTNQQTALAQAQQEQKTQSLSSVKTMVFRELTEKISTLPAAQLGLLFAMIDHQRLLLNSSSLNAPYTPEELQTGYTLLQRPLYDDKPTEPEKTGLQYPTREEKHTDSPKTLSLLFPPVPQPSSSLSSSSSSSATSILKLGSGYE